MDKTQREVVQVANLTWFWRHAAGPTSQSNPAIPFWTLKEAEEFFDEAERDLPWAGVRIYKRTWRGLVTVREYRPNDC